MYVTYTVNAYTDVSSDSTTYTKITEESEDYRLYSLKKRMFLCN